MDVAMVQTFGLAKRFGGMVALDDVDLKVERGSLAGLIGPNGAGKSTLFNVITGLIRPDRGSVHIAGANVDGLALGDVANLGVGRAFQTPRGFSSMTVTETLCVVPHVRGEGVLGAYLPWQKDRRGTRAKADAVLATLGLEKLANRSYGELSGGDMRLAEIARHLMRDVEVLLLDEPTAGVHPNSQRRLAGILRSLCDQGMTILIVEHNLRFIFSLADSVTVMTNGRVLRAGSPDEVQRDPAVISAYLGEDSG